MRARAVDLGSDSGGGPGQRGDLGRDGEQVPNRGSRLQPGRQADDRYSVGPRALGELAPGGRHDSPGAKGLGRLVTGDRLLGVARVAGAQHGTVGQHREGKLIAALGREGARQPAAERDSSEVAADRRTSHPAHHEPAWRVERLDPRRLDSPQRVAQMVRERENVFELVGVVVRTHDTSSPGARVAPSPSSAPASTRAPSPIWTSGAMIDSVTLALDPIREPGKITDPDTTAPSPRCDPRAGTARG